MDGYGGALYCGTGCFHRRESLCGRRYSEDFRAEWNTKTWKNAERSVQELEEASKVLANCDYEKGTLWGKEVSLYLDFYSPHLIKHNTYGIRYANPLDFGSKDRCF